MLGVLLSLGALTMQSDSAFLQKGDGKLALVAVGATATALVFDERIARWARQPSVQGDSTRHDRVSTATVVNEVPLTIAAVATYGIGRIARSPTIADVGAHLTEALVATTIVSEVVRIALGRARPRASPHDAFELQPGQGLTQFEYRAFPSLHAAVAFATAGTLVEEMRVRKVRGRRYAAPLLYAAATIPGFTRIYLDQHWASDVVAGTALGVFLGTRIVKYSHGRRTKLDRILLPDQLIAQDDRWLVIWSFAR